MELSTLLLFLSHTALCLKGYTENNQRKHLTVHFHRGLGTITVKNNKNKKSTISKLLGIGLCMQCVLLDHISAYFPQINKTQDQGQELLMYHKAL